MRVFGFLCELKNIRNMKNIEKFVELSDAECEKLNGGWWPIIVGAAKVVGALAAGYSIGYGWGSYDCDCPENDGRRLDEIGPTHNRA